MAWEFVPLDEVGYAYVARAPAQRLPAAERLATTPNISSTPIRSIAEDAYREFGIASYDEVAQVADRLPFADAATWIEDPRVPEARKGFYGLALGLAKSDADRRANRGCLQRLIERRPMIFAQVSTVSWAATLSSPAPTGSHASTSGCLPIRRPGRAISGMRPRRCDSCTNSAAAQFRTRA